MSPTGHVSGNETATLQHVPAPARSVGAPTVLLLQGRAAPSSILIDRPLIAGRSETCDLRFDDDAVSRIHLRLVPTAEGVEVTDLRSRNGTFVDGIRLDGSCQTRSAIVRAGNSVLRIAEFAETPVAATATGPLVGGTSLAPVRRQVALVGPTALTVLVTGETGTGKDVVAHLLHQASGRRGPLVAVNCAALPESLVESELFGHARGAFTGAQNARAGLFGAASEGTLFLDEVGELPEPAQAKLLRVLEDGIVRPVGSEQTHRVDVRVISATNRDLESQVQAGRFRTDLYARLAAVHIRLPAVRERPEDLPALCDHLLARAGAPPRALSARALEAMAIYRWPMNVRELDSVLRTASLTAENTIELGDLPEVVRASIERTSEPRSSWSDRDHTRNVDEPRLRLEAVMREEHGNIRRAAHKLGLSRAHIYRLLEKHKIDAAAFRPGASGDWVE